jgi:hypothetical protein
VCITFAFVGVRGVGTSTGAVRGWTRGGGVPAPGRSGQMQVSGSRGGDLPPPGRVRKISLDGDKGVMPSGKAKQIQGRQKSLPSGRGWQCRCVGGGGVEEYTLLKVEESAGTIGKNRVCRCLTFWEMRAGKRRVELGRRMEAGWLDMTGSVWQIKVGGSRGGYMSLLWRRRQMQNGWGRAGRQINISKRGQLG